MSYLLWCIATAQYIKDLEVSNAPITTVSGMGIDDVNALSQVIHSLGSLKDLWVGDGDMSAECVHQMVRTVLSQSSLRTLLVFVPKSVSPLDYIETISDSLTELTFLTDSSSGGPNPNLPSSQPLSAHICECFSSTKLCDIMKMNTTLKELALIIPLEKNEVYDIIKSLQHNHTLTTLKLSQEYHSHYSSESEQPALDNRIKWLDL